ncbi:hypothetical protein GGS23DRAFT_145256 [Durotheca rogersii]|uniref:uncharacterized protein n=1 Tax=Durotheca rogersii TaxID=419775 RepID=UPI002220E1F0|nr:uncharacterized protein GGS23DRAFT_145256 [Durotheca rogersii]KAI5861301.1 hypothetical protein GGS23DRAFT_145256 [Durotheca rogersii]
MSRLLVALAISIALLMVDSVIELSLISSMVGWLHRRASQGFSFRYEGSVYPMPGEPLHLMVDQGHTSNGAAGTAFVIVGLGGIVALSLRNWFYHRIGVLGTIARSLYRAWVFVNIPAFLLTTLALAYVFAVTNAHEDQIIYLFPDLGLFDGEPYRLYSWTPQNWFSALLELDLVDSRDDIQSHLSIMRGWQYNLIPMFIIQLGVTLLALWEFHDWRTRRRTSRQAEKP